MGRYKKYFKTIIKNRYLHDSGNIIITLDGHHKVISKSTDFAASSENPLDKRLDFSAYFLALVKILNEQGESYDNIRITCLEIVKEYIRPKNKLQLFLKQRPPKLINTWLATYVIKGLDKKLRKNTNAGGFIARIITDRSETFGLGYGIDILECGICKLFKKHNYEKYASILCEVDKLTSSLAGLELVRTGTIALGAKKCDFRFKRKNRSDM